MAESDGQGGFYTSSFTGGGGNCVAVKQNHDGSVQVRHSKDPEGGTLHFTPGEWEAFVLGVKAGEFDPVA